MKNRNLSHLTKTKEFRELVIDFPNLSLNKQPFIKTIIENASNKNGTYKLHNLGYFDYMYTNLFDSLPIKEKSDLGNLSIDLYEEHTFENNEIKTAMLGPNIKFLEINSS